MLPASSGPSASSAPPWSSIHDATAARNSAVCTNEPRSAVRGQDRALELVRECGLRGAVRAVADRQAEGRRAELEPCAPVGEGAGPGRMGLVTAAPPPPPAPPGPGPPLRGGAGRAPGARGG